MTAVRTKPPLGRKADYSVHGPSRTFEDGAANVRRQPGITNAAHVNNDRLPFEAHGAAKHLAVLVIVLRAALA